MRKPQTVKTGWLEKWRFKRYKTRYEKGFSWAMTEWFLHGKTVSDLRIKAGQSEAFEHGVKKAIYIIKEMHNFRELAIRLSAFETCSVPEKETPKYH